MKKFYKLKKWLTIDEAARRLSIEVGEEVTNADILQLAVDEQLRMSVNFPHNWYGKICDITTDLDKGNKFKIINGLDGNPFKLYEYEKCNDNEFIKVTPDIIEFKAGVWELKLIGNEKIDLEWELRKESNLPQVDVFNLSGFYVKNKDGVVIERQSTLYPDGYKELQKEIKRDFIESIPEELSDKEKADIFEKIKNRPISTKTFHYPCAGIGEIDGSFFVIQTDHLNEFLASLDSDVESSSKLDLDNAMYLLGEVLQTVGSRAKKWTQGEIIDKILEHRQNENISTKGLKQRTIEEYFSNANKRLKQ